MSAEQEWHDGSADQREARNAFEWLAKQWPDLMVGRLTDAPTALFIAKPNAPIENPSEAAEYRRYVPAPQVQEGQEEAGERKLDAEVEKMARRLKPEAFEKSSGMGHQDFAEDDREEREAARKLARDFLTAPIMQPGHVYVEHDNEDQTGEWMDGEQVNALLRELRAAPPSQVGQGLSAEVREELGAIATYIEARNLEDDLPGECDRVRFLRKLAASPASPEPQSLDEWRDQLVEKMRDEGMSQEGINEALAAMLGANDPPEESTPNLREKLNEFDAWLSFRGEFHEVLTAFRDAFGTDTSGTEPAEKQPTPGLLGKLEAEVEQWEKVTLADVEAGDTIRLDLLVNNDDGYEWCRAEVLETDDEKVRVRFSDGDVSNRRRVAGTRTERLIDSERGGQ